jgi:hypothetical protein
VGIDPRRKSPPIRGLPGRGHKLPPHRTTQPVLRPDNTCTPGRRRYPARDFPRSFPGGAYIPKGQRLPPGNSQMAPSGWSTGVKLRSGLDLPGTHTILMLPELAPDRLRAPAAEAGGLRRGKELPWWRRSWGPIIPIQSSQVDRQPAVDCCLGSLARGYKD